MNAADGSQVWQYDHFAAGISVAPSIDEDHVYFESETGVTALRRDTGHIAWNTVIEHGAGEAPPIPVGDRVYVSGYA